MRVSYVITHDLHGRNLNIKACQKRTCMLHVAEKDDQKIVMTRKIKIGPYMYNNWREEKIIFKDTPVHQIDILCVA